VFGDKLIAAVESGAVEPHVIDQACRRILRVTYRFAEAEDPLEAYGPELVASAPHRALALEAAEKSAVLLTNNGVLPLDRTRVRRLAVLGELAVLENTGDFGSSRVRPPYVVTALEGLRTYAEGAEIFTGDERDLDGAGRAAADADAVVVVVGYTAKDEGEYIPGDIALDVDAAAAEQRGGFSRGGDRDHLGLPERQVRLIETAVASGKPVVVVIVAGSAVLVEPWIEGVGAALQTFYSGMEGGTALARLLFGEVSPSGKLPFTVARSPDDYPFFDKDADSIEYGPYHGYTLLEREDIEPRFAFGHGLSYARFGYRALSVRRAAQAIELSVAVRNDGSVAATEVVQAYVGFPGRDAERPRKLLRAFARVELAPGETRVVRLSIPLDDLRWYDPHTRGWRLEAGDHVVSVGGSSRDAELLHATVRL
jgi:beta-glucosidase